MEHYNMNLTLKVWRQKNAEAKGGFETYEVKEISSEMSFLEMFDVLNEKLVQEGKDPLHLTVIVVKAFVVRAACILTEGPMVRGKKIRFASCTCALTKMEIPLLLNHGDQMYFRLLKI